MTAHWRERCVIPLALGHVVPVTVDLVWVCNGPNSTKLEHLLAGSNDCDLGSVPDQSIQSRIPPSSGQMSYNVHGASSLVHSPYSM